MQQQQMNAIVFEGPGVAVYKKIDRPICGPNEVVVKIHRIGICGTDVEIFHGKIGKVGYPIVPGHEWAGEIAEIGSDVLGYAVGEKVVGETTVACGSCPKCRSGAYNLCIRAAENGVFGKDGACCEYMVYPAAAGLHKFDARLSYDQACLIEPSAVVYRGLEKISVSPRDVLAVIGPGTIGLLTVAAAKHFGVRKVVLVGYQQSRLELGLRLGADAVINLGEEDYLEKARHLTNNELFTAIIEASGNVDACEQLFSIAGPGCRVCLLGTYGERLPRIDATKIVENDMEIHGSLGSPGVWDTVVDWMEATSSSVTDLITHHFNLEDYVKALTLIEKRDPSVIKVLIHP